MEWWNVITMQKASTVLAVLITLSLMLTTCGCFWTEHIEIQMYDVYLEVPPVIFATLDEGTLEGPLATSEPPSYQQYVNYTWNFKTKSPWMGGEEVVPSPVVFLDACPRYVAYGLGFPIYSAEHNGVNHSLPVCVIRVYTEETWAFLASGSYTEGHGNAEGYPYTSFHPLAGAEPEQISGLSDPSAPMYTLYKGVDYAETGMVLEVKRYNGDAPSTYVFGFSWSEEGDMRQRAGSVVINPGEQHILTYKGWGDLDINISKHSDDGIIHYEGDYHRLPEGYRTGLGLFHWEGRLKETKN